MRSSFDFDDELLIIEARQDIDRAENIEGKLSAMRRADMLLLRFFVGVSAALVIFSFIYVAMPESRRMALRAQEQIVSWR